MTDHGQAILLAAQDRVAAYPASQLDAWKDSPAKCQLQPGDWLSEHSLRLEAEALANFEEADW